MRRMLPVLALVILWTLPNTAVAAPGDAARGSGAQEVSPGVFEEFRFSARSGPLGENPSGRMSIERSDGAFLLEADVFCLSVTGNLATLVGDITRNEGAFNEPGFEELVFKVNDNTDAGTADTFARIVTSNGSGQAECFPETTPDPIESGRIAVRDS